MIRGVLRKKLKKELALAIFIARGKMRMNY